MSKTMMTGKGHHNVRLLHLTGRHLAT